jgi:hypothetical protein
MIRQTGQKLLVLIDKHGGSSLLPTRLELG